MIILPSIIALAWRRACTNPTIQHWHSVAMLCAVEAAKELSHDVAADLRLLKCIAYAHAVDLEPVLCDAPCRHRYEGADNRKRCRITGRETERRGYCRDFDLEIQNG